MLIPVLIIFYEFVLNMSNSMCYPALVEITTDLNTRYNTAQLSISTWLAGIAFAAPFMTPLANRFGRRPFILGGMLTFLFFTLLTALAPTIALFILARFFQGIGVATFLVLGYVTARENYCGHTLYPWLILAPMVAPLVGGSLLIVLDWRLLFTLIFLLALLPLFLFWFFLPETNPEPKKIDLSLTKDTHFYARTLTGAALFATLFIWISASPYLIVWKLKYTPFVFGAAQVPVFGAIVVGRLLKKRLRKWGLYIAFASAVWLVLWNLFVSGNLLTTLLPMAGVGLGYGALPKMGRDGPSITLYFLMAALGSFWVALMDESILGVSALILIFSSFACFSQFSWERMKQS
ncbi:MAG: MFS transporter [Chlamydiales bacterium]|nr:MFS transporter [Chlamydiales bacterium]